MDQVNDAIDGRERIEITSLEQLRRWLGAHHEQDDGVWLITYNKHRPEVSVGRMDVLDELILRELVRRTAARRRRSTPVRAASELDL